MTPFITLHIAYENCQSRLEHLVAQSVPDSVPTQSLAASPEQYSELLEEIRGLRKRIDVQDAIIESQQDQLLKIKQRCRESAIQSVSLLIIDI